MINPRTLAAAFAALFLLSACNSEPTVVGPTDPQAEALKNAPKVTLPPAIRVAKTYRCKDNSVVYVSFLADNVTAAVRDKEESPPRVTLKAPGADQPFVAEGFSLSGSGDTVTYTSPDSGTQSCRA